MRCTREHVLRYAQFSLSRRAPANPALRDCATAIIAGGNFDNPITESSLNE
jgi:hypothetical protein